MDERSSVTESAVAIDEDVETVATVARAADRRKHQVNKRILHQTGFFYDAVIMSINVQHEVKMVSV